MVPEKVSIKEEKNTQEMDENNRDSSDSHYSHGPLNLNNSGSSSAGSYSSMSGEAEYYGTCRKRPYQKESCGSDGEPGEMTNNYKATDR